MPICAHEILFVSSTRRFLNGLSLYRHVDDGFPFRSHREQIGFRWSHANLSSLQGSQAAKRFGLPAFWMLAMRRVSQMRNDLGEVKFSAHKDSWHEEASTLVSNSSSTQPSGHKSRVGGFSANTPGKTSQAENLDMTFISYHHLSP